MATHSENIRDAIRKGRKVTTLSTERSQQMNAIIKAKNIRVGRLPKLAPDKVTIVRQLRQSGMTQKAIATQLGVSQPTISNILNSKLDYTG
jgi:DNA invertase Pin-like site-specific DNA recombinase